MHLDNIFSKKEIVKILNEIQAKPLKRFGQNFLINKGIAEKMAKRLNPRRDDIVLEIGGGLGQLTSVISQKTCKLVVIEKDKAFASFLKKTFKNQKNICIIEDDAINILTSFSEFYKKFLTKDYKVIGNLPYNSATKIIELSLTASNPPKNAVFMLQKEVAERITAQPPKMNYLACKMQYLSEPKILFKVSKENFWPKPKVESAVIEIKPKKNIEKLLKKYEQFNLLLKSIYNYKRKKVLTLLRQNKNIVIKENLFKKSDIEEWMRPNHLSVKNIIRILEYGFKK